MKLDNKILSDITVYMKYAKFQPLLSRRENWNEIVQRNMDMHIKKFPELESEIREAYQFVFDKKVLPSMRSMQFAGRPIEINPARIYNCAYLPVNDWQAFSEIMFLLLGGTGIGFSVQKEHIALLPEIKKPSKEKSRRWLIGDSIEGWADAIKVLMKSYYKGGAAIRFDYSDIRPKGALLVTAGGKAPGPAPLRECLVKIEGILEAKEDGQKLNSIEVHDIVCHIADAVLAGGIRRAALISLFSADDDEMIACKSGNWWELNPQRGRANNSAVLLRQEVTEEYFFDLWKRIELSNSGEPGIYFTNDSDWGTNPCVEIALRPFQFCVSGDTRLITKDGITNIENAVDKEIEIWNGKQWSSVTPYKTGDNDRLHRVWFNDGSYLDATDNHKFLVKNRFEDSFNEVETLDLIDLLKSSKYGLQVPRANVVYDEGGFYNSHSYDYGFIIGDGFVHSRKKDGSCRYVEANLYNEDKHLEFSSSTYIGEYSNYNGTKYITVRFQVDSDFAYKLKYETGLPTEVFSWNRESILAFVAGWADADGSQASTGIRIYGREDKLRDLQLLLTKVGINCSINLASPAGTETNLGRRNNDLWYVQITRTIDIPCQRLICDNETEPKSKGKYQLITRIETLSGFHKSFCLTENKLNQCVFNNVLTKQCNLCEINAGTVQDQEDLNARAKAASFIGTLQATYTDFHYLRSVWKRTTEKDALIGVGMTGIADGKVTALDLNQATNIVVEENTRVADLLGINSAARTTCVKPSGTTSLVLGTSSGIHGRHSNYYLRRIRVGKNEAIYSYLKEQHPELVEDCYFRPHDTAIISVPQASPDVSILRNETPIDLLNRVKLFSDKWIKPGHQNGINSHNVSATISIKADEWEDVGKWMWENKDSYNGLSVLPYDGGTYVQAPFEEITESDYNKLISSLSNVNLNNVLEENDNTDLSGEVACAGGACEI